MTKKILVLGENPPISYLNALRRVFLDYDCRFYAKDFSKYSGLLLTGGGDVLPSYYGKNADAKRVNFIRDEVELSALKYFIKNSLPVFAVCRGLQVLNVFFGGTLKCVSGHLKEGGDLMHGVINIAYPSFPFSAVNSCHAQAVDKLAKCGKVLLCSTDGVIEAASFGLNAVGVQFHPERMSEEFSDFFYSAFAERVKGVSREKR